MSSLRAKRSNPGFGGRELDCFVASAQNCFAICRELLAMTSFLILAAHGVRVLQSHVPPENRGRRECRAPGAPAASCAKEKSTRVSHHRFAENVPAFPARWF